MTQTTNNQVKRNHNFNNVYMDSTVRMFTNSFSDKVHEIKRQVIINKIVEKSLQSNK